MIEQAGHSPSAWNVRAGKWLHTNVWLLAPRVVIVLSLVLAAMLLWGINDVAQGTEDSSWLGMAFFGAMALHFGLVIRRHGWLGEEAAPDEREMLLQMSATRTAGCVMTLLVAVWALLLGWFADRGMWFPRQPHEWEAAGRFIVAGFFLITILAAAWMTPAYAAELLDED
jgi:hypothetical protein